MRFSIGGCEANGDGQRGRLGFVGLGEEGEKVMAGTNT
jgi:hypothetical protein